MYRTENSKLMADLNSTKAQLHFEESKIKSLIELEKVAKTKVEQEAKRDKERVLEEQTTSDGLRDQLRQKVAIINQKDSQIVELNNEITKAKRESELAKVEV